MNENVFITVVENFRPLLPWRKFKIKTLKKVIIGETNSTNPITLVDFSDALQIKDIKGNPVVTAGVVPPLYMEE